MPSCCVCYTTDPGYLLPTFVSAMQARQHASAAKADVAIFSIGGDSGSERAFARVCAAEGISFYPVAETAVEGAGAMLARLFLDRIAPDLYQQFLYIDGDTQIAGSLDLLLDADVPKGQFLAVSDPMTFSLRGSNRHARDLTAYFSSLGISVQHQQNYFNSGVIRFNRDGWAEIGRDSWDMFRALRGRSRFPDQDALNLVAMDRRITMSMAWNFPIFLRNAKVEPQIKPRIYHYMGSPKPWHGSFPPWGAAEYEPYLTVVRRYPELADISHPYANA